MTTTEATAHGLSTAAAIDKEVEALGIRGCIPRKSRLNEYALHKCRCNACTKAAVIYSAARYKLRHSQPHADAVIRAWARNNDHSIGGRGPVPAAVIDAYRQATGATS